jgi:transcriptional regulator with XRE-family HTH domain
METRDYLDALKAATAIESDYGIAKRLNVTRQAVSNWRTGVASPDALTCYEIARLIGANPAKVIADIELERASRGGKRDQETAWRRVLERIGGTAAAVVVSTALIGPSPAQSSTRTTTYGETSVQPLYIMSTRRRTWRAIVDALASFVTGPRLRIA